MSLLSRIKGWWNNLVVKEITGRSEGFAIDLDLLSDELHAPWRQMSKDFARLGEACDPAKWVEDRYLKPKPSHVENYLGAYGSNRWVG